jgi:4-aminobutyrate aminotransferase
MVNYETQTVTNGDIESKYDQYVMPIWKALNVPVKSASGCVLTDFEGNDYLDLFSGISVTNVGRGNEAVAERTKAQLDAFVHGCSYVHPNEPVAELAERLAAITPGDLSKTFFCNSGTEAVEGAVKLARKYTGSKEVISLEMAFHGRTLGSLALTGNRSYKSDMGPTLNDTAQVPPPYQYRCPRCDGGDCTDHCASDIERVIDAHTTGDLAAIIVEPVMGEGGIIVPPDDWLSEVKRTAREHDALLIVDEVQSGYGRTGEMWAVDHTDVDPDILTQAKGIANGLPLGAFTATPENAETVSAGDHLSTFGGNPVTCAAALATIDELQDGIVDNAASQGEWVARELDGFEDEFTAVGDVRGRGLMWGIEMVDDGEPGPMNVAPAPDYELAKRIGDRLRTDHGIVIGVGGFYKNVLRIQPPLTISRAQLEGAIESVRDAIATETQE